MCSAALLILVLVLVPAAAVLLIGLLVLVLVLVLILVIHVVILLNVIGQQCPGDRMPRNSGFILGLEKNSRQKAKEDGRRDPRRRGLQPAGEDA